MSGLPKYTRAIGRLLSNLASTIGDDSESYCVLQGNSQYILCPGFCMCVYETHYL